MERCGLVWTVNSRQGIRNSVPSSVNQMGLSQVRFGLVWSGEAECGAVRCGGVWCGTSNSRQGIGNSTTSSVEAWHGQVGLDAVRLGLVRLCPVWRGMVWNQQQSIGYWKQYHFEWGQVRCVTARYGEARYGKVRYGLMQRIGYW